MTKTPPKTVTERSAGAVVFHVEGAENRPQEIKYLLLLSTYWGFPKGLIEGGEDERAAAVREVREETGLVVALIEGFRQVDDYWYRRHDQRIHKQAIYFLAEAPDEQVTISWEHKEWVWLNLAQAMERLAFPGLRQVLASANEFLLKRRQWVRRPSVGHT
jgi:8-oxo-dGTP pyrophosphatase MutT (NUDIX family)